MNKTLIRIISIVIFISPVIFVSGAFKDLFYMLAALIILAATVDISKKKKANTEEASNLSQ